jgi:multidrug efflux pump subunit AcrA (membrane-fusion protein)
VVARGTGTLRASELRVDTGSVVKKGQALGTIEPVDDTATWELAAMSLKLARVQQSQAELARDLAEDEYTKVKRVHDNQPGSAVSARRLDELNSAWQTQKLAAEFAKLAADRVELTNKQRMRDHKPVAPFDGFIAKYNPRVGDPITAGEPLCTVMNIDAVVIDVFFPAKYLFQVRLDQRATVQIEGLPAGTPDAGLVGRVVLKGESVDPASRTFPVRVELQNPRMPTDGDRAPTYFENYAVRPGMRAVVRIAE